ncbi:MAG TPA: EI24 domain-containing protein [Microlunatus sp.]|nr:EI24 domain-containing protein [Microlunatus sp.]
MANPVSEAVSGFLLLVRGLGLVVRRPRNFLLGAVPPLITSLLFLGVLAVLLAWIDPITRALSPFARGWSPGWADAVRVAIGVALVGASALLMVVTFSAITLAIGGPIYDKISEYVEREFGPAPSHEEPLVRGIGRAIRQSLGLIAVSALGAIPLFLAGFLPVVGQTVVPVLGAMFGGWLLVIELLGGPFERRGLLTVAERRTAMRRRRLHVWGFGAPTFALLAVPFLAVVVFPAAAAGATLLAREIAGTDLPAPREGATEGP